MKKNKMLEFTQPDTVELKEAKKFLRENWEEGAICPCCTQIVKLYKRAIHFTQGRLLISLYWLDQRNPDYYHINKIYSNGFTGNVVTGSHDFSKLGEYGLVEQKPKVEGQKGRTSGYWGITEKGKQFVRGEIKVPAFTMRFNGKVYRFSDELLDIREVLGTKFDYDELMKS